MGKTWDIFISHASEDKNEVVRELAKLLTSFKLKVWYDEFSLNLGDSLVSSIDKGLNNSRYGLVIISKNFLNKKWTDYEYKSLITKEINDVECLLPIWHNVTKEDVRNFSLYLADKVALDTSNISLEQIAVRVCKVVRPQIIEGIKGYLLFKEKLKSAKKENVKISDLKEQQTTISKLSESLIVRARNIHFGIGQQTKMEFEKAVYNYELDLHPEREIQIWEIMNSCYLEFIFKYNIEQENIKHSIYKMLLNFTLGNIDNDTILSFEQIDELMKLWKENNYDY